MTATQSQTTATARRNPFWINLRFRVRENKKMFIAYSVLQLFGLPLMALVGMLALYENSIIDRIENGNDAINTSGYYWYSHGETYFLLGGLCCGLAMLIGLMFVFRCFDYLSKKSRVDMTLALPVTTRQRFWSDFCSGFAMYAIPLLAATALAFAICGIGAAVIDCPNEMEGEWGIFFAGCGNGVIYVLLGMFSLYVFAALACVCCGTQTETPLTAFALYALPPIVAAVATEAFFLYAYGVDTDSVMMQIMNFMGPVGAASAAFQFLDSGGEDIKMGALTVMTLKWAVPFLLGNAALLGLTRYLYGRRKAEDTAKPFVYRLIYYIIMTAAVFCMVGLCILTGGTFEEYLPLLFFVGLVYLMIEAVVNRGFRKLYWGALRFACSVAAVFLFSAVLEGTNFFGIETRVPDADNVKSVEVSLETNRENRGQIEAKLTDEQAIALVTRAHQAAVDRFLAGNPDVTRKNNRYISMSVYDYDNQAPDERNNEVAYFEVTYQLKSGTSLERHYSLNEAEWTQLLELWTIPQTRELVFDHTLNISRHTELGEAYSLYIDDTRCQVTQEEMNRIREAYLADSEQLTVDTLLYGNVVCDFGNILLYSGVYDNTLNLLTELNLLQTANVSEQLVAQSNVGTMLLSPTLLKTLMDGEPIWGSAVSQQLTDQWNSCTTQEEQAAICSQICWIDRVDVQTVSSYISNNIKQSTPCWCFITSDDICFFASSNNAAACAESFFAAAQKPTPEAMELVLRENGVGIDDYASTKDPLEALCDFTGSYCWDTFEDNQATAETIDAMINYLQTGVETELLTAPQASGVLPLGATTRKELCEKIAAAWQITHPF